VIQADLHTHTDHSDGSLSPGEVVFKAVERGLKAIAITDHDTISGLEESRDACLEYGITFVAGVEISSISAGYEVHLLGYGFDSEDESLLEFLAEQRGRREERALEFVRVFRGAGIVLDDNVEALCRDGSIMARPHLARLLVEAGAASSIPDAFRSYLVEGTATFVPKRLPDASEVIRLVHLARGKVSVAHPGNGMSHSIILSLIQSGLDAIEIHHPSHDEVLENYYSRLAHQRGLSVTGGSDYHGWRDSDEERFGKIGLNGEEWAFLRREWTL
jgi:3',5'-nucleoside bisphosphate phosphatase